MLKNFLDSEFGEKHVLGYGCMYEVRTNDFLLLVHHFDDEKNIHFFIEEWKAPKENLEDCALSWAKGLFENGFDTNIHVFDKDTVLAKFPLSKKHLLIKSVKQKTKKFFSIF